MELYQINYFVEAVRCRNITKAAEELNVSQPAVSRAIKNLEDEIGAELFDRIGRNIVLNDNGKAIFKYANAVLEDADKIKESLEDHIREREQTVNLFSPVPLGDDENVLIRFKELHPEIKMRLGAGVTEFTRHEIPDLMFFASPTLHHEPNMVKLCEERVVLAVPKGHPVAGKKSVRLADLSYERYIKVLPCVFRTLTDGMFAEAGFEPDVVIEDQRYSRVMKYIGHGFGLTLAPEITWFDSTDTNVAAVPLEDVHRSRYLYLRWREEVPLSTAASELRDYLVEHFKRLGV